jgi:hypothetical protein
VVRRNSERGDLSLWLIAVMAIVVGLVWAVPMVFLGHEEASRTADLVGATGSHPASGPRQTGAAPVDPIGKTNDVGAQADLNNAVQVAQMYFAENGSYTGFTPQAAAGIEPTITFTAGPAASGTVSIRGVTATSVVLVTATARGPLCAAAESSAVSFGRTDAQSPAQCTGGW